MQSDEERSSAQQIRLRVDVEKQDSRTDVGCLLLPFALSIQLSNKKVESKHGAHFKTFFFPFPIVSINRKRIFF